MNLFQRAFGFSLVIVLSLNCSAANQGKDTGTRADEAASVDLHMTSVGEARLSTGRRGAFRIYAARDGTTGTLTYGQFQTAADAKHQVSDWTKLAKNLISREQTTDRSGKVTGDRIVAQSAKGGKHEFIIIRRDDVNCYLVESPSLAVARQVEELTK